MTLEDVDQVAQVRSSASTSGHRTPTGGTFATVAYHYPRRESHGRRGLVVGFCGYWLIEGDPFPPGCIRSIRLGLGYLLARMLATGWRRMLLSHARARVSNSTAVPLQQVWLITGRRRRYYRDNHEDALHGGGVALAIVTGLRLTAVAG